jgi:RND family efflux transporter MFP subunit
VDPIYAYFNVDERSVLKYVEQIKAGQRVSARQSKTPVYLQLENEKGFPHEGVIDFISNRYNVSTGTLQVRGVFPNPDGFLTPGSFVQARVAGTAKHQALLMTDRAVGTDQGQKFVLVVEEHNLVGTRPVELGPVVDGLRVIRSGLKGDEQVIINGLVNARPGSPVNPQPGDIHQFASLQLQLQATTRGTSDKPAGNPAAPEPPPAQGPPRNPAQQGR